MNKFAKAGVALLAIFICFGCASKKSVTPVSARGEASCPSEEIAEGISNEELLEKLEIQSIELARTREYLARIESKLPELDTAISQHNNTVTELKENQVFINEQIQRMDRTIGTMAVKKIPPAANVATRPGTTLTVRAAVPEAQSAYNSAITLYKSNKYEEAVKAFSEYLLVWPSNQLSDNAQYWIGESWYAIENFPNALESLIKVFYYPDSNKVPDAHFKIAKIYALMGEKASALEEFEAVIVNYPGTEAAKAASVEKSALGVTN